MNEKEAVNAVYTVLNNAKATLVSDLTHSGADREIKHLAGTNLAPPVEYYAIAVYCTGASEGSMPGANNITGISWDVFNMVIQVADVANIQKDDLFPYEQCHNNFRDLVGRIVELIRITTSWFPSPTSSPRFRMPTSEDGTAHKPVNVENESFGFEDTEGNDYAMLFSRISFTLIDHCADDNRP